MLAYGKFDQAKMNKCQTNFIQKNVHKMELK